MFVVYMLKWWYGAGWVDQWKKAVKRSTDILKAFSGGILIKTLFSPWKQIITGGGKDTSIKAKSQAMLDNIISRFVGFGIRMSALIAAIISLVVITGLSILWAIIWPLLPLSPIISIALFVFNVGGK